VAQDEGPEFKPHYCKKKKKKKKEKNKWISKWVFLYPLLLLLLFFFFSFFFLLCFVLFFETGLCSPGWPGTRQPPASTSLLSAGITGVLLLPLAALQPPELLLWQCLFLIGSGKLEFQRWERLSRIGPAASTEV
jgi:ABC-type sugar transport system permease subunit